MDDNEYENAYKYYDEDDGWDDDSDLDDWDYGCDYEDS